VVLPVSRVSPSPGAIPAPHCLSSACTAASGRHQEWILPFSCWVWVSFFFVFLHFVFKPERSLTRLMEWSASGLGKQYHGCRNPLRVAVREAVPAVSLLPFTHRLICLCLQKGFLIFFFFSMFTRKPTLQTSPASPVLFVCEQPECCGEHIKNSLITTRVLELYEFSPK